MLVVIYEWPALYRYYEINAVETPPFNLIFYWLEDLPYLPLFPHLPAKLLNIEDFEGDAAYGRNTDACRNWDPQVPE